MALNSGRMAALLLMSMVLNTIILFTTPLADFTYLKTVTNGISVGIPLSVGLTKCYSQICQAYNNAVGVGIDWIDTVNKEMEKGGWEGANDVKTPWEDPPHFTPPTISMSAIRSDPQGIYFYCASITTVTLLAVSISIMAMEVWYLLGNKAGNRMHRLALSLHFTAPLLYILMTMPVVLNLVGHDGNGESGNEQGGNGYTWEMWAVLTFSALLLASSWLPFMSDLNGQGYSLVPEVDELDLENHNQMLHRDAVGIGGNGGVMIKNQPWRTGKGTPKR
eukprot:CAMPEP_0118652872 /NCGR_PEP_ID=MMETSP0785-20121206/11544_1 /TAXON_ID=91992 /ORGANISM="Bolidomonas pacifica, Strain CCMP 1866" /LENGTH=276 /DNA_ID=CAMNT_0006545407 /DNA_START=136 /DNA_END=963 /DNA_ORIENTATION=-